MLRNANLSGANLTERRHPVRRRLTNANLSGANLTNVKVGTAWSLRKVEPERGPISPAPSCRGSMLTNANLIGANLTNANLSTGRR